MVTGRQERIDKTSRIDKKRDSWSGPVFDVFVVTRICPRSTHKPDGNKRHGHASKSLCDQCKYPVELERTVPFTCRPGQGYGFRLFLDSGRSFCGSERFPTVSGVGRRKRLGVFREPTSVLLVPDPF